MALSLAEYARLDLTDLRALVTAKEISAAELLAVAERGLDQVEPRIQALSHRLREAARAQLARLPEGVPGVPFLLKEDLELAGLPLRYGSGLLKQNLAPATHDLARRYEQAGLLFIGQTKMGELGLLPYTESRAYGATHNPWNLAYSAGGSSGGTGAAVAARVVPAGHGSDGGGSIRVPAAINGLFGLKPSRGRMPAMATDDADGFIARHALTRSVRDSAWLLDVGAGHNAHNRFRVPEPAQSFVDAARQAPGSLRIAFSTRAFAGGEVDATCHRAIAQTATWLADLGHHVEEVTPTLDFAAYARGMQVQWAAGAGHFLKQVRQELQTHRVPAWLAKAITKPRAVRALAKAAEVILGYPPIEDFTLRLVEIDQRHTPGDMWRAWNDLRTAQTAFAGLFERYDVFMTSTLGEATHRLGTFDDTATETAMSEVLFRYINYCPIANTSGLPAMSVPLHTGDDGMPVGMHFMGAWASEGMLLALASQLEQAHPWGERRPPVCVGA